MERTSDFEQLLFLYKTEGKGISLEQFCINNGINYHVFDRWHRNHHEGIGPVHVVRDTDDESNSLSDIRHLLFTYAEVKKLIPTNYRIFIK